MKDLLKAIGSLVGVFAAQITAGFLRGLGFALALSLIEVTIRLK